MPHTQFRAPILLCLSLLASALPAVSQEARIRQIQQRFAAAKPDERALAFYSLDWAMNLAEARARAQKEDRPIFMILNTNISAGTNFFSGHT